MPYCIPKSSLEKENKNKTYGSIQSSSSLVEPKKRSWNDTFEGATAIVESSTETNQDRRKKSDISFIPSQSAESHDDNCMEDPFVGMKIDFRDQDFIWSSAIIVMVHHSITPLSVTVRYDGWPKEHDEIVEWDHSPRIAKLFTYTRAVKCFARLLPTKGKKCSRRTIHKYNSDLWPCKVLIRMPHPNDRRRTSVAEELLRLEQNILVQPYGFHEDILPKPLSNIFSKEFETGRWVHTSILLPWRSTTRINDMSVVTQDNFENAMELALSDTSTPGFLPSAAFEKGSLLCQKYRLHTLPQSTSRTGELVVCAANNNTLKDGDTKMAAQCSPVHKPPSRQYNAHFPGGIRISDSDIYDCDEITPSQENPKHYSVQVKMGENDLFLGEFPTKSLAALALRMCVDEKEENAMCISNSSEATRAINDIKAIAPETVIAAWKKSAKDRKSGFCPQEWLKNLA